MANFDILVLSVLGLSAAFAFWRGFSTEALSLASWGGAVAITLALHRQASTLAATYMKSEAMAEIAALIVLFVLSFFLLRWLADRIGERVRESSMGPLDRLFGAAFGIARGLIVISFVYLVFDFFVRPAQDPEWLSQSRSGALVKYGAELMQDLSARGDHGPRVEQLKKKAKDILGKDEVEGGYNDQMNTAMDGLMDRILRKENETTEGGK